MDCFVRTLCTRAVLVATVAAALTWAWPIAPVAGQQPVSPVAAIGPKFLGALSCSATACHGSVTADTRVGNIHRNEYVSWIERDPHARSHETLSNARSKTMFERLGIDKTKYPRDPRYENCLACHSPTPPVARRGPNFSLDVGVDCESCHGPAENWLDNHYRAGWSPALATAAGMTDTKNLAVRADLCAGCHVGSADRQVNHDLIAAGHPPLKFELTAYHDLLPEHWNLKAEKQAAPHFESRLWIAGQIAAANASLTVLATQADAATAIADGNWPEFAHYDCFACHHDLAAPSWRQARGFPGRKPGNPPLSRWYFSAFEQAAQAIGGEGSNELAVGFAKVRNGMELGFAADPTTMIGLVNDLRPRVADWATLTRPPTHAEPDAPLRLQKFLRGLAGAEVSVAPDGVDVPFAAAVADWDTAAQFYLAAVALNQDARDQKKTHGAGSPEFAAALKRLRQSLAFPAGFDSPKLFAGDVATTADAVTTPTSSTRESARRDIEQILQLLKPVSESKP